MSIKFYILLSFIMIVSIMYTIYNMQLLHNGTTLYRYHTDDALISELILNKTQSASGPKIREYLDVLHIGLIIGKPEAMHEAEYLIKSILLHTNTAIDLIEFNIITSNGSQALIHELFQNKIFSPPINITYICVDLTQDKEATIIDHAKRIQYDLTYHHTKIYGLLKLFFHEFFPHLHSQKVIILDIDMIVLNNLIHLYQNTFDGEAIWFFAQEGGRTFNTGVFVCDYQQFHRHFPNNSVYEEHLLKAMYIHTTCNNAKEFNRTHAFAAPRKSDDKYKFDIANVTLFKCIWAEQSILNGLNLLRPFMFKSFDHSWNLGRCVSFNGVLSGSQIQQDDHTRQDYPAILHFNCNGQENNAFNSQQNNRFVQYIKEYKWQWLNYGSGTVTKMTA
eukprot:1040215_1